MISRRISLVGGVFSFMAVIVLSLLSLDMEVPEGSFMQEVDSVEATALSEGEGCAAIRAEAVR